MKQFRFLVLVLMALLLPLRGATAAAMLCHGAPGVGGTVVSAGHPAEAMHAGMPDSAHTDAHTGAHADHHGQHAGHGAGPSPSDADNPSADNAATDIDAPHPQQTPSCQSCASSCCLTPLGSAPPQVLPPQLSNTAVFPAPSAPALAFLSDGQDRPPRAI